MWRRRLKSTAVQIPTTTMTTPLSSPSSTFFSCSSFKGIQALFLDEIPSNSIFRRRLSLLLPTLPLPAPPESERRVVVYFTSLRVVRSTFEHCKAVRSILRGFQVKMDERDLSMDPRFVRELQGIMLKTEMKLPSVFIGGKYIGGAEEVMRLHESGELKKLVEDLPADDSTPCDVCDGHRFVLCDHCDGSHKMCTLKGGFKICTACSENGLTREGEQLDWGMRVRIAMGIAYCLEYMHQLTPPIAHTNLQSICLTEDYAAKISEKISDLSFWNDIVTSIKKGSSGAAWLLETPLAYTKGNVYGFGLILFELITGKIPYTEDNGILTDWAVEYLRCGKKPFIDDVVDPALITLKEEEIEKRFQVMRECAHSDPEKRPTMREVTAALKEITALEPEEATPKSPLWWAELEIMSDGVEN